MAVATGTRSGTMVALGLVVLATVACKDKKKPLLDAKTDHAAALATVGAYAPMLKLADKPLVAHAARRKIVEACTSASTAEVAKVSSLDERLANPGLSIRAGLAHVHRMCNPIVKADGTALAACTEAVALLDQELSVHHASAEKAGIGADVPATVAGWVTPEATAAAAPLAALGAREDKLGALWADEKATFEVLDAACKANVTERKAAPLETPAPGDELGVIRMETFAQDIERCLALLQFGLAQKVLGACIDQGDGACLGPQSCQIARGLKDVVDPRPSFGSPDKAAKVDPLPKALAPRAKTIVSRCAPFLR